MERFTVSCPADVYKFPFDTQTCYLRFEPSGYKDGEVILTSIAQTIDFREYKGTSGWTVESSIIETIIQYSHSYAVCSLTLKRKPFYFLINIFLPIVLLSVLNTFVFILPVESGEKASFAVTVFLSLAVFLTIISSKLPENSEKISLLNVYVFESTLLSTLVATLTITLICIHNKDPNNPVPACLKKLVKLFSGPRDKGIANENQFTTLRGKENKIMHPDNSNPESVVKLRVCNGVTWPDVVRALDMVLFVSFLAGYTIITLAFVKTAVID